MSIRKAVLIPRITFIPKVNDYPFQWQRRQFPVYIAFASIIYKSQGQTHKFGGLWLRSLAPTRLRFAVLKSDKEHENVADNIVCKDVLLKGSQR